MALGILYALMGNSWAVRSWHCVGLAVLRFVGPALVGGLLVRWNAELRDFALVRPAAAPLALFVALGVLMVEPLRHWLLACTAYCVAMLAAQNAYGRPALPPTTVGLGVLSGVYPWVWAVIALMVGAAAMLLSAQPGSSLAKRTFAAAIGVCLLGHGSLRFMGYHDPISLLVALVGAAGILSVALVQPPPEDEEPVTDTDIEALDRAKADRAALVASMEWRPTTKRNAEQR